MGKRRDIPLGATVQILTPVNPRDAEGTVVYVGGKEPTYDLELLDKDRFLDPETNIPALIDARNTGRLRPDNWKWLCEQRRRKLGGKPVYIYGPIIVKSVRTHKKTGKPLKPRFICVYPKQVKVLLKPQISRFQMLWGNND